MSQPLIHPTAIIDATANVASSAKIGPYCYVGPHVVIQENVDLMNHVVVECHTTIGQDTKIYPFAVVGGAPQALKYKGEPTRLVVGCRNVIREHATYHRGTEEGGGETRIGDDGLFMVGVHVAHDCRIGNHVIMANNATLGGHVVVGDHVYIGGLAAVHQFVRIGSQAMIGGLSGVEADVIPFGSVMGDRARLSGLNIIGMKRRGLKRETIHDLRNAYRMLFANEGTMAERLGDVKDLFHDNTFIREILDFMSSESERSYCMPKGLQNS